MAAWGPGGLGGATPRREVVPSGVLAMLVFVAAEAILFAGLLSAYLVARTGAPAWPPLGQPRLPLGVTAVNTLALLASGALLALAGRAFRGPGDVWRGRRLFLGSLALGAGFVLLQGYEWARLVGFGLTMRSSTFGSFFYLIVGAHALHAVAALAVLGLAYRRLHRGGLRLPAFWAISVFWYFVVAVWPVLYVLVYLA